MGKFSRKLAERNFNVNIINSKLLEIMQLDK